MVLAELAHLPTPPSLNVGCCAGLRAGGGAHFVAMFLFSPGTSCSGAGNPNCVPRAAWRSEKYLKYNYLTPFSYRSVGPSTSRSVHPPVGRSAPASPPVRLEFDLFLKKKWLSVSSPVAPVETTSSCWGVGDFFFTFHRTFGEMVSAWVPIIIDVPFFCQPSTLR